MLRADLKATWRSLSRNRLFSLMIVLSLGLAVGLSTTLFSLLNGVVLEPFPFEDASRLLAVWEKPLEVEEARTPLAPADFLDLQSRADALSCLAAYRDDSGNLSGTSPPAEVQVRSYTASLFDCLQIKPLLGRLPAPSETNLAVVGEGFWKTHLGGESSALGRKLELDQGAGRESLEIAAVVPSGLPLIGADAQLWKVLDFDPQARSSRKIRNLLALARLRDGATLDHASAQAQELAAELRQAYPETNASYEFLLLPLREEVLGETGSTLGILFLAGWLLVIIVAVNTSGLFFSHFSSRRSEVTIRLCLGAKGAGLLRLLALEPVVLGLLAGGLGLAIAAAALKILLGFLPGYLPRLDSVEMDLSVIGYGVALSILCGICASLPAMTSLLGRDASQTLKIHHAASAGRKERQLAKGLVAAQIALAIVLLVGAGLLTRSLFEVLQIDLGFDPSGIVVAELPLKGPDYQNVDAKRTFAEAVLEHANSLPGVSQAAITSKVAISGITQWPFRRLGPGEGDGNTMASVKTASPGYFEVLDIPLKAGRTFGAQDRKGSPGTVIINEAMAARFWPEQDPIGRQIEIFERRTIVGIVGNVRTRGYESPPPPEMYFPYLQSPMGPGESLLLKTDAPASQVLAEVRNIISRIDPRVPTSATTLSDTVAESTAERRIHAVLWTCLAAIALLFTNLGIYATVSKSVSRQAREIGIRIAVGARRRDIVRRFLLSQLVPVVAGTALGLLAVANIGSFLMHLLFEITSLDTSTLLLSVLLQTVTTVTAVAIPAARASGIDPASALRGD